MSAFGPKGQPPTNDVWLVPPTNDVWLVPPLVHEIKDTFFGVQPKLTNIKEALTILISPPFYIQLFAKCCIFSRNFLHPTYLPLRLSFRNVWHDKNNEIHHKREENRPQSDLYVVVNATRYFPRFGCHRLARFGDHCRCATLFQV